ncbi:MAG: YceI family protein [Bacteroidales bacterium]
MKKIMFIAALAGAFIFTSCGGNQKSNTVEESATTVEAKSEAVQSATIDLEKSKVEWKGSMLGLYSHHGYVNLKSAEISFSDGKISGGKFVVDMTTITPTDENFNPETGSTKEKLVGHLSSNDFFNVEEFPEATFEITGQEGSVVSGNLTIRGITKPEEVENVSVTKNENGEVIITGDLVFDRKEFDVNFDMPVQDKVLSNDIELHFELIGR